MSVKKYDVVGIGNAIVDILANVDEDFLSRHKLKKGMMKLVDEYEACRINKFIEPVKEESGGSAANTIAGLAMLGNSVAFIGKVRNDFLGNVFEKSLKNIGVYCSTSKVESNLSTARCIVLTTPDAQRTMNTHLGIAGTIESRDIDKRIITESKIIYLEGYLWDKVKAKKAFMKAIRISHENNGKVALSLSDPSCASRHREGFLELAESHIDILFANEDEIKSLFKMKSFEDAIEECKKKNIIFALTRSEKGSVIICKDKVYRINADTVKKLVDTTGAGDLYAAGFLHGFIKGKGLGICGRMGSVIAAEIVNHFGARPEKLIIELLKEKGF